MKFVKHDIISSMSHNRIMFIKLHTDTIWNLAKLRKLIFFPQGFQLKYPLHKLCVAYSPKSLMFTRGNCRGYFTQQNLYAVLLTSGIQSTMVLCVSLSTLWVPIAFGYKKHFWYVYEEVVNAFEINATDTTLVINCSAFFSISPTHQYKSYNIFFETTWWVFQRNFWF